MTKQRSKRIINNVRKIQNNKTPKQESEETTMTKKEKEIYEFVKKYNVDPFDSSIFFYIGGAFPKAKMENVLNVVNQLREDVINLNK